MKPQNTIMSVNMKVKELIKKLQEFDSELIITIQSWDDEIGCMVDMEPQALRDDVDVRDIYINVRLIVGNEKV